MRKKFLIPFCLIILGGCSIPASYSVKEIRSFTLEQKKEKAKMGFAGSDRTITVVRDFREVELYEEDLAALKEKIEAYIASQENLDDSTKADLRAMKVSTGLSKELVVLLLGEADKIMVKNSFEEIWIYRINKVRAFTVFILPVYFAHEGYYLTFKNNILSEIKRHKPQQTLRATGGDTEGSSKK